MRSQEQIQLNLEETEKEMLEVQEWANKAYERYRQDKKDWGTADYGEIDAAHSALNTLTSRVNALRWVLELQS
jgi:hypothetical protein